jgi:peptide/nickel transport system ATP-binding protein
MPERIGARYPHEVSGGQLQRFMIAMGLQEAPLLLVCDEPTSALDVTTQVEVLRSLKRGIRDEGTAALFVSHDLAVVAQIADRVAVLRSGRLVEIGATQQILSAPREAYTHELLAACRHLTVAAAAPDRPTEVAEPLLRVRRVSAGFGRKFDGSPAVLILHDVSLDVRRGRASAVIGESGSGKSTLASVIAGLHAPASGEVLLDGKTLAPVTGRRTVEERRRVQLVFQSADTALNQRHSVGRILGRVLRFFRPSMSSSDRERRIAELLAMVQLPPDYARRLPRQISGGEKQRVNLARALAAEPDVLICDEITSALDTVVAASIIRLVESLRDQLGLAIVFISHDLATVASLADDVTVLRHGRIVEQGATSTVLAEPNAAYTRLLISSVPELRIGWLEEAVAARAALRDALEPDSAAEETGLADVPPLPDLPALAEAAKRPPRP